MSETSPKSQPIAEPVATNGVFHVQRRLEEEDAAEDEAIGGTMTGGAGRSVWLSMVSLPAVDAMVFSLVGLPSVSYQLDPSMPARLQRSTCS